MWSLEYLPFINSNNDLFCDPGSENSPWSFIHSNNSLETWMSTPGYGQLHWVHNHFNQVSLNMMVPGTENLSWLADIVPAVTSNVSSHSVLSQREYFFLPWLQVRDSLSFSTWIQQMAFTRACRGVSASLNWKPSYVNFVSENHVLTVPRDEIRLFLMQITSYWYKCNYTFEKPL